MKRDLVVLTNAHVPVLRRPLTPAQFGDLADVPPELEWLANLTNSKTRRAYSETEVGDNVCSKIIRCESLCNPDIRQLRPTSGGKFAFFRPFDNHRNNRGGEKIFEIEIDPHGLLLVALRRIGSRL